MERTVIHIFLYVKSSQLEENIKGMSLTLVRQDKSDTSTVEPLYCDHPL